MNKQMKVIMKRSRSSHKKVRSHTVDLDMTEDAMSEDAPTTSSKTPTGAMPNSLLRSTGYLSTFIPEPLPPNVDMSQHYGECIKMSAGNKINSKNAFSLHLIDFIPTLMKENKFDNFQMASSSLEAGCKIFAGRVDALYDDTFHVITCLGRTVERPPLRADDSDSDDADEQPDNPTTSAPDAAVPLLPRTKKKVPSKVIVNKLSKIRMKTLNCKEDLEFHREAAMHDEGSTRFLRLNQIHSHSYPPQLLCDLQSLAPFKKLDLEESPEVTNASSLEATTVVSHETPAQDRGGPSTKSVEDSPFLVEKHVVKVEQSPAISPAHFLIKLIHERGKECSPGEISCAITVCAELEPLQFMRWKPIEHYSGDCDDFDEFNTQLSTMDLVNASAPPNSIPRMLNEETDDYDVDDHGPIIISSHSQPIHQEDPLVDLVSDEDDGPMEGPLGPSTSSHDLEMDCKNVLDKLQLYVSTPGSEALDTFRLWGDENGATVDVKTDIGQNGRTRRKRQPNAAPKEKRSTLDRRSKHNTVALSDPGGGGSSSGTRRGSRKSAPKSNSTKASRVSKTKPCSLSSLMKYHEIVIVDEACDEDIPTSPFGDTDIDMSSQPRLECIFSRAQTSSFQIPMSPPHDSPGDDSMNESSTSHRDPHKSESKLNEEVRHVLPTKSELHSQSHVDPPSPNLYSQQKPSTSQSNEEFGFLGQEAGKKQSWKIVPPSMLSKRDYEDETGGTGPPEADADDDDDYPQLENMALGNNTLGESSGCCSPSQFYVSRDIDEHATAISEEAPILSPVWNDTQTLYDTDNNAATIQPFVKLKMEKLVEYDTGNLHNTSRTSSTTMNTLRVKREMKTDIVVTAPYDLAPTTGSSSPLPVYPICPQPSHEIKKQPIEEDDDVIVTQVTPKRPLQPLVLMQSPRNKVCKINLPYVRVAKRVSLSSLTRVMQVCLNEMRNEQPNGILFSNLVERMLTNMPDNVVAELSAALIYYTLLHIAGTEQSISIKTLEDQSDLLIFHHSNVESDPDYIRLKRYSMEHGCGSDESSLQHNLPTRCNVPLKRPATDLPSTSNSSSSHAQAYPSLPPLEKRVAFSVDIDDMAN